MNFYTIIDDLYFYQMLSFVRKYSNFELKLSKYFYNKTNGVFPEFIVVIDKFIFFFVRKDRYFTSKIYLDSIRREISPRKVLIIRAENVFINLLFSFFPDLYIHDIKIEVDDTTGEREVTLYFLNYRDRGIAIGRKGEYIKCLNDLCQRYIILENKITPLEIKCKFLG
ncbi:MAG: hypothetical protein KGD58_09935 [Candidatus Lokiarchaeota archaeon]|nr:hypothetical protein [Candidatus Lokiarchaeota archaeon]